MSRTNGAWYATGYLRLFLLPDLPTVPSKDQAWRLNGPGQKACERRLYCGALQWWLML